MTRGAVHFDRRGRRPATLLPVALLALLAALAWRTLQPAPEAGLTPTGATPAMANVPPAGHPIAERAPAPAPEEFRALPAATTTAKARTTHRPAETPYRFIGRSTTDGEPSIVLFGRGRVVTLRGPGPLDDEYVVDAVFDDYLVLRHVPTSVGKFLQFEQRKRASAPPRDPEDSPRD